MLFHVAKDTLARLQDDLDWSQMKPNFKREAARWARTLSKLKDLGEVDQVWKLVAELHDFIRPDVFIPGWMTEDGDGSPPRVHAWVETDPKSVSEILRAVRCALIRRGNRHVAHCQPRSHPRGPAPPP